MDDLASVILKSFEAVSQHCNIEGAANSFPDEETKNKPCFFPAAGTVCKTAADIMGRTRRPPGTNLIRHQSIL